MYIQPSRAQLEFVQDIETGLSALRQQNTRIMQLRQVVEAAGYDLPDFSNTVAALEGQSCWDLLLKLKDLLDSVQLRSPSLNRALEYLPQNHKRLPIDFSQPGSVEAGAAAFKLETEMPPLKQPPRPQPVMAEPETGEKADKVREQIIGMLNPLSKFQQHRIIGTVAHWFGVGT